MFTTLFLDGAMKIVQIIRYRNQPPVARIYDPRGTTPEAILQGNKYNQEEFVDELTGKKYQNYPTGMVAI